jgi:hypothetical protein
LTAKNKKQMEVKMQLKIYGPVKKVLMPNADYFKVGQRE